MEVKKVTPVYDKLANCKAKTIVNVGGARSSKSYSIAQLIIQKLVSEKCIIGVTRKTFPALRMTAYALIIDLLKNYGIYRESNHNKTEHVYRHNDSRIQFFSLDEPEKIKCYHPDTEILSRDGFIPVKDANVGQEVATLNPATGEASYEPITKVMEYDYKGEMYEPHSANNDRDSYVGFSVTPEHKMLISTKRKQEWRFVEAENLPNSFFVPRSGNWGGIQPKSYKLGKDYKEGKGLSWDFREPRKLGEGRHTRKTKVFGIILWLRLLGWYLSEGSISSKDSIFISQTKPQGKSQIKKDLARLPYKVTESDKGFTIYGNDLSEYMASLGKATEKRIPREILSLHPNLLWELFNSLMAGDGIKVGTQRWVYSSSSRGLIDDVSELSIKLGLVPTIREAKKTKWNYPNMKPHWIVSMSKQDRTWVDHIETVPYLGKVYCVTVPPYHNVLIRYNNRVMWSGQSAGFSYIWMEEGNEFTYQDYVILKLRLSEPTKTKNHIFISLNPIDENNWVAKTLIYEDDVEVIHSTYKDNPFLDKDYITILQNLESQDSNFYRIYTLGEWGKLGNLIYTNYDFVDELPKERQAMAYGLDFGYVNPVALVKVCLIDNEIYLQERIYKSHITNSELIEMLSHEERGDIYADRDELQRIEEILRAGYNCYPGEKDVKMGIDLCSRHKLHITKDSVNLIKEVRGYQRKVDKNGIVLEDPVKYNDHLCDAFRFGIYGMVSRFGFATAMPFSREKVIHRFRAN